MIIDLTGKNVVVTGSAGLIGGELCRQLADSGANLFLIDVADRNKALCAALAKEYPNRIILESGLNVSTEANVRQIAAIAEEHFGGKIHGLVNCLQYKSQSFFHEIKDTEESELHDIFAANVFSIFWMMKHLGASLTRAEGASVVNLSSTYALVSPNPEIYIGTKLGCPGSYVATKGAVYSLTKYLACYYAKDKIRVNSVTPHGVYNNHEELFVKNFSRLSPLNRMSQKEEVAPSILFLLSDKSEYITGANLPVDGGWTAW